MEFAARLARISSFTMPGMFKVLERGGIISFAGGVPDPALLDVEGLVDAAARSMADTPQAALQYGPTEGLLALRLQLSQLMSSEKMDVPADDLVVTTGCQQALEMVAKTLLSPGDRVLVEAPTFVAAIQCFRLHGAEVIGVPTGDHGIDIDTLEQRIARDRPKLVYLVPSFGNPTGANIPLSQRMRILHLAERHGLLLVEDNPYSRFFFDTPPPPTLLALSQSTGLAKGLVIYCGSLSKVVSPGLRLGWLVVPPEIRKHVVRCKLIADTNSSGLSQIVAANYLESGRLPLTVDHARIVYRERATIMGDALEAYMSELMRFRRPEGGLFVWGYLCDLAGAVHDGDDAAEKAIRHKIAVLPGSLFHSGTAVVPAIRLSFATTDASTIREGIRLLASALGE